MSASAPSHTTTLNASEIASTHKGHRITKVGSVAVDPAKGGGFFTVYYCQDDHALFSDIK